MMNNRLNIVWGFIRHYKYLITVVVCVLIVGFLDDNSFMKRVQYELQINDLKNEINKYQTQYDEDTKKLYELQKNPKAIEKIARERYFMKASDEDIYVLSDDGDAIEQKDEGTN